LAAAAHDDWPLAFYPFADFSPELAALRWARDRGVPAFCCDLPLSDPAWRERARADTTADTTDERTPSGDPTSDHQTPSGDATGDRQTPGGDRRPASGDATGGGRALGLALRASLTGRGDEDLWDRLVEATAPGAAPEAVRVAALAVGWAMRHDTGAISALDLRREEWMRATIAAAEGKVAAVIGAFHAPALLEPAAAPQTESKPGKTVISLVPYTFELLDARSGYPAGIRDPQWQQAVFQVGADPAALDRQAHFFATSVVRAVRGQGHPGGPAEAAEGARLATDLARLRGLPAPGRGELVEALQSVLAQGEPAGRGRAVAAAMQLTLVGQRHGRLAPQAPVSGLLPAMAALLAKLKLPGPGKAAQTVRLDPLRSPLDLSRELALQRLAACRVPYGEPSQQGGSENLTSAWRLHWTPSTDAALAVAALHGATLPQAATGMLTMRRRRELEAGGPTAPQALQGLEEAARCGLENLVSTRLDDMRAAVAHGGTLTEIVAGIQLLQRIAAGHLPGATAPPAELTEIGDQLHAAGAAAVEGLAGSTRLDDARALLGLVQESDQAGRLLRLRHAMGQLARDGSPLMRGASSALLVVLAMDTPAAFGERLASWIDLPAAECAERLRGALVVTGALLQAGGEALTPLLDAIDTIGDDAFVRRLPALRAGFDVLSPADRDRLLQTVTERHGDIDTELAADPATMAGWVQADRAGSHAVRALGLGVAANPAPPSSTGSQADRAAHPELAAAWRGAAPPEHQIPPAQRWRLLLGRQPQELSAGSRRLADALDELYGAGRGEGAYTVGKPGGGREGARPQARQWLDELEALFGAEVRDEVLGRAAQAGRVDALLAVDPQHVRPSMDLLHHVLSLAGAMPEARLARIRPLVKRLVDELTAQLARQIRPALTGLGMPRRTRRPTGRLDLAGTLRANLHTVRLDSGGRPRILPERPVFRSRGKRSVAWQVVILTDVSGSMEPSTIWAALTASILGGVPTLRTHFVTFSTEVIDLTDRVSDPLSLLLEISVGGGTHIAAGLHYARQIITVPARTIVVVISDFEEGYPVSGLLSAVRALVDDGVTLLGCASLDDLGQPRYSTGIAAQLVAAGMPVAALSPLTLARWIGERVR